MKGKGCDGKVERKWAEEVWCLHPARLRFWEMDPRVKPEDDSTHGANGRRKLGQLDPIGLR